MPGQTRRALNHLYHTHTTHSFHAHATNSRVADALSTHALPLLPYAVLDQVTHGRPPALQPAVSPRDQEAAPPGNQGQGNHESGALFTCQP